MKRKKKEAVKKRNSLSQSVFKCRLHAAFLKTPAAVVIIWRNGHFEVPGKTDALPQNFCMTRSIVYVNWLQYLNPNVHFSDEVRKKSVEIKWKENIVKKKNEEDSALETLLLEKRQLFAGIIINQSN